VMLFLLVVEQIPGSDLLHDITRKVVITITVCLVAVKLLQPIFESSNGGSVRGPRRQKKTDGGSNAALGWASSEMQGWRPAMEDATCIVASLPPPFLNQALFAVFDGHGGAEVSLIVSKEFPKVLAACAMDLLKACDVPSPGAGSEGGHQEEPVLQLPDDLFGKCLHSAMLTMDGFLRKGGNGVAPRAASSGTLSLVSKHAESPDKKNAFNLVGSTAIVVLVDCGGESSGPQRPRRITVANCGDSRAILSRNGKAIELSEDHKPELPGEEERIKGAGGHVAMMGPCHRIDGWGLNLSRALGDFHYKGRHDLRPEEQKVIAVPEIRTLDLTEEDDFLVLGCDGIFELHTSQKVVDIVHQGIKTGMSTEKVVEDLVDKSCSRNLLQSRGKGGDNCSAIVVRLRC